MQQRYSKVNFRKLVKDLADMYSDHTFDVVIAELVANSLDSEARSISIEWDEESQILVVTDDGNGMTDEQFEEYHNLAAELKSRGTGIGFAGVGAKISFNLAGRVITETRHGDTVNASDWHWNEGDSLTWSDIESRLLPGNGTRVEVRFNQHHTPPGVDAGYIRAVLRRHYLPLFITDFARSYEASGIYVPCPTFTVNGTSMPWEDLTAALDLEQVDKFQVKDGTRPIGLGAIGLKEDAPTGWHDYGVLLCTHGKVIKPEMFGLQTGALGTRLFGIVEIPTLIQFVTTNKSELKGGRDRYRELEALLHPVREEVQEFLAKHGVAAVEQKKNQLSVKLETELTKMLKGLPELQDFDGLLARSGKLRRSETGAITATAGTRQNTDGGGKRTGDRQGTGEGKSRGSPLRRDTQGRERAKNQRSRRNQGPRVAFEEHPGRNETAWLDVDTIIINSGHKAYCQQISQDQAKLTYCMFSIGVALDKAGLDEPADGSSYVDKFIAAWGAA